MDVYEAIKKMKQLSDRDECFSFSFMSYSIDKNRSHGIVTVERARLIGGSRIEKNRYADYMLNYIDMDTLERKSCWKILLLEFNNIELNLQ